MPFRNQANKIFSRAPWRDSGWQTRVRTHLSRESLTKGKQRRHIPGNRTGQAEGRGAPGD